MIAYVRGVLAEKGPDRVVIEAGGVGYELLIPVSTFDRLPKEGGEAKLLAWHCVREDDEALFGFATKEEREMFLKLTQVSGVGPKIALAILSGSSIGELSLAIASGNAQRISSIKCVELKDKVNAIEALAATSRRGGNDAKTPILHDAILALSALGFSDETANKMVSKVLAADPSVKDVETLVRLALASR